MTNPLVSILIPSYNRAHLIQDTLNSVQAQSYQNWECIIVDDGSTDKTVEVVNNFIEEDSRFKFYSRPEAWKKGASACRNFAFELSHGDLIQFLDSDDLLENNKLEEQVKLFAGGATLITCKWGGFDKISDLKKRFKYRYHSYKNFSQGVQLLRTFGGKDEFFPPHVYLTPRNLIIQSGKWNEDLTNNDDAEFFTRVILKAKGIKFTPNTAVYYRYSGHEKLSSFTNRDRVNSAILSWKLIEGHIQNNHPNMRVGYVENAKRFLKVTIQEEYPDVIKKEQSFFISKRDSSFYSRLKRTVSKILSI